MSSAINRSSGISPRFFPDLQNNVVQLNTDHQGLATDGNLSVAVEYKCGPLREAYVQGISVLPALVAFENLAFLVAIFLNRAKLKHNNVYRYVASALVANLVTSALGFYHFVNYFYGFEPTTPNNWWAFRKGMTLALSLIMSGNIGLLIYGIEDCTYVVGRSLKNPQKKSGSMNPELKRRKARVLILLVWALPTCYGLLAMTDWNCTRACSCTLSYGDGRAICPNDRCSRLYTPMSKSFLLGVFILWALECLGLLVLLCNSVCAVRRSQKGDSGDAGGISSSSRRKIGLRKTLAAYNASHRVVIALFLLFVACSAPIMIMFVLDFVIDDITFNTMLVNFVTPLSMLYCLISPILVTQRLSGLKSAILMAVSVSRTRVNPQTKANGANGTNGAAPNGTAV